MHRVWTSCTVCSHWLLLGGERPGHNTKQIVSLTAPFLSRQRISLFENGQCKFYVPEILYKLLGTNLFPHKEFTKSYKESSGLIACGNWQVKQSIGHFRVPKTLSLKTRLSANPFL